MQNDVGMTILLPILRVFRVETWLTVYRALYILKLLGYPMGGLGQRLSVLSDLKIEF